MYEGHFTKKKQKPNNNMKKTKGREGSCRASSSSSAVESELHRSTLATEVTLKNKAVSTDEACSTPEKHTRSTCRFKNIWQDNFGGRLEGLLVQMQCRWGFQCTSYQEKALHKTLGGLEELFVSCRGDNLGSPERAWLTHLKKKKNLYNVINVYNVINYEQYQQQKSVLT